MGIKGLWPALRPYTRDGHLRQFRQQRVAVDMYVWLHCSTHSAVTLHMPAYLQHLRRQAQKKKEKNSNDSTRGREASNDTVQKEETDGEESQGECAMRPSTTNEQSSSSTAVSFDNSTTDDDRMSLKEEEEERYQYDDLPSSDAASPAPNSTSPPPSPPHDPEQHTVAPPSSLCGMELRKEEEEEDDDEAAEAPSSPHTAVASSSPPPPLFSGSTPSTPLVKAESQDVLEDEEDKEQEALMERLLYMQSTFIDYVVKRVDSLLAHQIIPMPLKAGTDKQRRRRRLAHFRAALQALEPYQEELKEAWCQFVAAHPEEEVESSDSSDEKREDVVHYASNPHSWLAQHVLPPPVWNDVQADLEKAFNVTTELAAAVMRVLREDRHVECIVAPFEADAELSYLCREGYVSACISEDSDLIAYFCPQIIAKLDRSGRCDVIQPAVACPLLYQSIIARKAGIPHSSPTVSPHTLGLPSLGGRALVLEEGGGTSTTTTDASAAAAAPLPTSHGPAAFTYELFLVGCIMSGCDYLPNLHSIGVKRSFALLSRCRTMSDLSSILLKELPFSYETVRRYLQNVYKAFYAFSYHIVYCPMKKCLRHLKPIPSALLAQLETSRSVKRETEGGHAEMSHAEIPKEEKEEMEGGVLLASSSSSSSRAAPLEEIIGAIWPQEIGADVCAKGILDPTTFAPYRGRYLGPCVDDFWRRTRAGQRRLTEFGHFKAHQHNTVVLGRPPAPSPGGAKRWGSPVVPTGGALALRREPQDTTVGSFTTTTTTTSLPSASPSTNTSNTVGAAAAPGGYCGRQALSGPQHLIPSLVMVRSRHFIKNRRGGWSALCGDVPILSSSQDSNSSWEEEEDDDDVAVHAPGRRESSAACATPTGPPVLSPSLPPPPGTAVAKAQLFTSLLFQPSEAAAGPQAKPLCVPPEPTTATSPITRRTEAAPTADRQAAVLLLDSDDDDEAGEEIVIYTPDRPQMAPAMDAGHDIIPETSMCRRRSIDPPSPTPRRDAGAAELVATEAERKTKGKRAREDDKGKDEAMDVVAAPRSPVQSHPPNSLPPHHHHHHTLRPRAASCLPNRFVWENDVYAYDDRPPTAVLRVQKRYGVGPLEHISINIGEVIESLASF
eukprot:gene9779-6857_t